MPRPRARTTLLAVLLAATGGILLARSLAIATVVGSPHDFSSATGPHPPNTVLAPGGACSACHVPHAALDNGIWRRTLASYRTALNGPASPRNGSPRPEPNFVLPPALHCYDCHDFHGAGALEGTSVPALTDFAVNFRPQDTLFGYNLTGSYPKTVTEYNSGPQTGKSPRSGFYETNPVGPGGSPTYGVNTTAPLANTGGHYFRQDPSTNTTYDNGDKLPCRDCHDPHAWNASGWQAFMRNNWPTSAVPNRLAGGAYASAFMSNQSTPSGQRNNQRSRELCIACHGISGPVELLPVNFSDIQSVNPPTQYRSVAIMNGNPPPAAIAEHASTSTVACVSCHDHNSVGASCSQCHGFPPSDSASPAYPVTATSTFVPAPLPGANDSHPRHYGSKSGLAANSFSQYSISCDVCHYGSFGAGSATLLQHQNNLVSVVIAGVWTRQPNGPSGLWDNTNYYNRDYAPLPPSPQFTGQLDNTNNKVSTGGWGNGARLGGNNCRNVYCHSAGRDQASMALDCTVLYPRPTWNSGPLQCNDCHGFGTDNVANGGINWGMPGYPTGAAGSATANSHLAHVVTSQIECSVCHAQTAGGSRAARFILPTVPSQHVDGNRDVVFDGTNATGTYDNTAGSKRCDVSCHGRGKPVAQQPQWGAGTLAFGCFACHSGTEQLYKPQEDYGTPGSPNPVDNVQYLATGHGLPKGQQYPDNNAGAGFGGYAATPSACYVCHSQGAAHFVKSPNDPFRLGATQDGTLGGFSGTGGFTGAWGNDNNIDSMCLGCHGSAAQRAGHDNAAVGAIDMQTHSLAVTGGARSWPVTPWKCVDCHDPHGDGSWAMIRSGINAPNSATDTGAGSDQKSRTKRIDANVRAVTFTSRAGFAAGSYAVPGTTNWGICEVCHNQTTAYSRTLDNVGTHAGRTSSCSTCHLHSAGFAGKACKGCHGPDGVATAQAAPEVTRYWTSSGHGMTTPVAINLQCEACHDTGFVNPADHKTDGSAGAGPPPANVNTQIWPGKVENADNRRNQNTAHLSASYFPAGFPASNPANKFGFALAFDRKCGTPATGCHPAPPHNQHPIIPSSPQPGGADNVLTFGQGGSVANPKSYNWYPAISDYPTQFYLSRSSWDVNDITTNAAGAYPDNNVRYGLCVSCHDPHGTSAPVNRPGAITNYMLRGDSTNMAQFCGSGANGACHTSRTPP